MNFKKLIFACLFISWSVPVVALDMSYSPEFRSGDILDDASIYLDGPVEFGDDQKLHRLLEQHPDVKEVIVGQSPGGSLHAGIEIAEIIFERRLSVKLEGPAASAATVISLGSQTRIRFQGDFAQQQGSSLLFHCAYLRGNDFCDEPATRASAVKLAQFSDWSVDRWMRVLMSTTPATTERISLWDILDRDQWDCEAEAHLSVVCRNGAIAVPAITPVVPSLGPDIRMVCNTQGSVTNIRRGPSAKNFPVLDSVENGQQVIVLREVTNSEGYLYLEVEFSKPTYQDTVIGYVYHEAVGQACN